VKRKKAGGGDGRAQKIVVDARQYVDDRVSQSTRELSADIRGLNAKIDGAVTGLNAKIDGAVVGLNAKIDGAVTGLNAKMEGMRAELAGLRSEFQGLRGEFAGLSAKMDAVLQIVGPMFDALRHLQGDVDTLKEMLTSKGPIGFRKDASG